MDNTNFNFCNSWINSCAERTLYSKNSSKWDQAACILGLIIPTALDTICAVGATLGFVLSLGYSEKAAYFATRHSISIFYFPQRVTAHFMEIINHNRFMIDLYCDNKVTFDTYKNQITQQRIAAKQTRSWLFYNVVVRFGIPAVALVGAIALTIIPLSQILIFSSVVVLGSIIPITCVQNAFSPLSHGMIVVLSGCTIGIIPALALLVDPYSCEGRIAQFDAMTTMPKNWEFIIKLIMENPGVEEQLIKKIEEIKNNKDQKDPESKKPEVGNIINID